MENNKKKYIFKGHYVIAILDTIVANTLKLEKYTLNLTNKQIELLYNKLTPDKYNSGDYSGKVKILNILHASHVRNKESILANMLHETILNILG